MKKPKTIDELREAKDAAERAYQNNKSPYLFSELEKARKKFNKALNSAPRQKEPKQLSIIL